MKHLIVGLSSQSNNSCYKGVQTKHTLWFICVGTRIPAAAIDVVDLIEKSQDEYKRQQLKQIHTQHMQLYM